LGIVGMMGNSVGPPAWSSARPPWESPEAQRPSKLWSDNDVTRRDITVAT
jgi:hypothetical protein